MDVLTYPCPTLAASHEENTIRFAQTFSKAFIGWKVSHFVFKFEWSFFLFFWGGGFWGGGGGGGASLVQIKAKHHIVDKTPTSHSLNQSCTRLYGVIIPSMIMIGLSIFNELVQIWIYNNYYIQRWRYNIPKRFKLKQFFIVNYIASNIKEVEVKVAWVDSIDSTTYYIHIDIYDLCCQSSCQSGWSVWVWMGSANERRSYIVTEFLIGWAHTQDDPCNLLSRTWTC